MASNNQYNYETNAALRSYEKELLESLIEESHLVCRRFIAYTLVRVTRVLEGDLQLDDLQGFAQTQWQQTQDGTHSKVGREQHLALTCDDIYNTITQICDNDTSSDCAHCGLKGGH